MENCSEKITSQLSEKESTSDFKHPFNKEKCKERLLTEYRRYKTLIVAFDFDNTIFDLHDTGEDFSDVIDLLKRCESLGFTLILFTTEETWDGLTRKRIKCLHMGITDFYVNEGPLFPTAKKPYYNILLDDRAGLEESYEILKYVVDIVEAEKFKGMFL